MAQTSNTNKQSGFHLFLINGNEDEKIASSPHCIAPKPTREREYIPKYSKNTNALLQWTDQTFRNHKNENKTEISGNMSTKLEFQWS